MFTNIRNTILIHITRMLFYFIYILLRVALLAQCYLVSFNKNYLYEVLLEFVLRGMLEKSVMTRGS